jgi:hypothetical protein
VAAFKRNGWPASTGIGGRFEPEYSFINELEGQRGKKITDAQADELIAAAQEIIDML